MSRAPNKRLSERRSIKQARARTNECKKLQLVRSVRTAGRRCTRESAGRTKSRNRNDGEGVAGFRGSLLPSNLARRQVAIGWCPHSAWSIPARTVQAATKQRPSSDRGRLRRLSKACPPGDRPPSAPCLQQLCARGGAAETRAAVIVGASAAIQMRTVACVACRRLPSPGNLVQPAPTGACVGRHSLLACTQVPPPPALPISPSAPGQVYTRPPEDDPHQTAKCTRETCAGHSNAACNEALVWR
jgi:hypothetical protein